MRCRGWPETRPHTVPEAETTARVEPEPKA